MKNIDDIGRGRGSKSAKRSSSATTKRKRTRGKKRKPKPLHQRSGPKFFGHGMKITYNDLRDIGAALNDKGRVISSEVRKAFPIDLCNAINQMPTAGQEISIFRLLHKMDEQYVANLIKTQKAILHKLKD